MLLHLSTACNMQCRHCFATREKGTGRQGQHAGAVILMEDAAVGLVDARIENGTTPSIVEIGGPGEPLLYAETYEVLRRLHDCYPDVPLSVWTNGLLLSDRLAELTRAGASHVTLSVPAATQGTAERIYEWVTYRGRCHAGRAAAELVLQQQWNGLSNAVEAGMQVTVYIASLRGVNDHEVETIRLRAGEIGAERIVVVPRGR
jgi:nitrogen fixation protein NifB